MSIIAPPNEAGALETVSTLRGATVYRAGIFDRAAVSEDARTVELTFSSEAPVERWFGTEILDHGAGSIRMDWISSGRAPFVMEHNLRDQVGVIEAVTFDGKTGRARVRFGRSARAEEIFQDVKDGIRTSVSVGYRLYRLVLEEETDTGATYRAVDWEPYEVSLVAYPADPSVGVGRGQEPANPTHTIIVQKRSAATMATVPPTDTPAPAVPPTGTRAAEPTSGTPAPVDHAAAERSRIQSILDLGRRVNMADKAEDYAFRGASLAEFQGFIAEEAAKRNQASPIKPATEIGMGRSDIANYSLFRAMRAAASKDWSGAGLELEASRAVAKSLGKESRGFFLPFDVLARGFMPEAGARAGELTTATTGNAGGRLVATDHMAGSFIELLRAKAVIGKLGARMLSGLVGNVDIPKQTGGASVYWIGEGDDTTRSGLSFGQLAMSPKTISAEVAITRRLAMQSSPLAEQLVRQDLIAAVALGIDRAVLAGAGGAEPLGILGTAGVALVSLGTDGGVVGFDDVIDLETEVSADDADVGNLAYVTNARGRGLMKKTQVAANTARFVWEDNEVNGYTAVCSNQVPANLTKGAGAGLSALLFGNFADVVVAEWGVLDIKVDEAALGASGGLVLRAFQDVDTGLRHAQSFAVIKDMQTA